MTEVEDYARRVLTFINMCRCVGEGGARWAGNSDSWIGWDGVRSNDLKIGLFLLFSFDSLYYTVLLLSMGEGRDGPRMPQWAKRDYPIIF